MIFIMYIKLQLFCLFLSVPCCISLGFCDPIFSSNEIFQPVIARNAMVASDNKLATEAGIQILKEGGNAIDAAVTVGFTLAATYPRAGNIGGGGFMLIYLADSKEVIAIDYREKAPKAAKREMFLDGQGNVDNEKSRHSYLAVGVPGSIMIIRKRVNIYVYAVEMSFFHRLQSLSQAPDGQVSGILQREKILRWMKITAME